MSDINKNDENYTEPLNDAEAESVAVKEEKPSFICEVAEYAEMIAFALIFVVLALTFPSLTAQV